LDEGKRMKDEGMLNNEGIGDEVGRMRDEGTSNNEHRIMNIE